MLSLWRKMTETARAALENAVNTIKVSGGQFLSPPSELLWCFSAHLLGTLCHLFLLQTISVMLT